MKSSWIRSTKSRTRLVCRSELDVYFKKRRRLLSLEMGYLVRLWSKTKLFEFCANAWRRCIQRSGWMMKSSSGTTYHDLEEMVLFSRHSSSRSCSKFDTMIQQRMKNTTTSRWKKWTKKSDTFNKDKLLLPISVGQQYWISAMIDMRKRRIHVSERGGQCRRRKYYLDYLFQYITWKMSIQLKKSVHYQILMDRNLLVQLLPHQNNAMVSFMCWLLGNSKRFPQSTSVTRRRWLWRIYV